MITITIHMWAWTLGGGGGGGNINKRAAERRERWSLAVLAAAAISSSLRQNARPGNSMVAAAAAISSSLRQNASPGNLMVAAAAAISSSLQRSAGVGKLNGGGRRGHIIKLAAQRWSGEAHWWRRWRRWRQQAYKRSLQWRDWGAKTLRRRRQQPRQGLRDEVSFYFFSCLWCLLLSLLSSPVLPPRPFFVSIFLLLFSTFFICRYF